MLYASINDKDVKATKSTLEREAKGVKLMEQTCQKGLPDSCYLAGQILIRTVKPTEKHLPGRNPLKAIEYFERSCAANHAPSCFNLAVMYKNGDVGVHKSEEKFTEYKKKTDELVGVYGSVSGTRVA